MSLDATRLEPARQPEAVATGFEGQRNPRDRAAGPDRLILPAMQQAKQPFWVRIELLAWLTLNAGKHAGNEPTRLAQLDDGNDRAILVQGDEGSAQSLPWRKPGSFGWGIAALHRLDAATKLPFLAARPIASTGPFADKAHFLVEKEVDRDHPQKRPSLSCGTDGSSPCLLQR